MKDLHGVEDDRPQDGEQAGSTEAVDDARRRLTRAVALWGGYAAVSHVAYQSPVIRSFIGVRNAYAQATVPLVRCAVASTSIDFGDVDTVPASTSDRTFRITNTGVDDGKTEHFTVTGFVVTNINPMHDHFTIVTPPTPVTPFTLNGSISQKVTVRAHCNSNFSGVAMGWVAITITSKAGTISCDPVSLRVNCVGQQPEFGPHVAHGRPHRGPHAAPL